MKSPLFSLLLLILTIESECSAGDRFFISAPGVFHVGVQENVFVQMGGLYLNSPVTLYLESNNIVVSERKTVVCSAQEKIKTVQLMVTREVFSRLPERTYGRAPYLRLMAESPSWNGRKETNVLVSKRRGNIFIQTNQPIYNPEQKVRYRIFTLDNTFRPIEEVFQMSIFNAAGNRVMKTLRSAKEGIFTDSFRIPNVAKMGTWRIEAQYGDDSKNAASREFKVQRFVLPSFEVNIANGQNYILLADERFDFNIIAKYSHGEFVRGAYHCQFGVVEKATTLGRDQTPHFIRGLELTGSVEDGNAAVSLNIADLETHLRKHKNQTLSTLQQKGSQIFLAVFVTNIQSGEMQDAEVYIPVISHRYTIDFSRTRSHFIPGCPLDVMVLVHLPDGSPAVGVLVEIKVSSMEKSWHGTTDHRGAVFPLFNIQLSTQITVEVSVGGLKQTKVIPRATSPSDSYLCLSYSNMIHSVGDTLSVSYNVINSQDNGNLYYMVLSRGLLIGQGSYGLGHFIKSNLQITTEMVPSFHLIGYFYDQHGNIIADSVWVDVRDECKINAKVESRGQGSPGASASLTFDLHGQTAKVALLAVDKAMYALKADNRLTAKQVFSSMESLDQGCSYSGGSDPTSVLKDAGLSFMSLSHSDWKRKIGCESQAARRRRSVELQQEIMSLKSNFSDETLQECCAHGFSVIPMERTCQERAQRVSLVEANPLCADAFLRCCLEGERLRQIKAQEEAEKGLGRTDTTDDIEQFFLDITAQYVRRYFPESFAFTEFTVKGKQNYVLPLPDSITTWEIQVITLSAATGFCVVKPHELRAFKEVFVSLTLPYSVRKYEQLSISPVIYNYGYDTLQLAVHMEQTEGLCSPGSATTSAYVNITLGPQSSQVVSFSAVPMVPGPIPIKIRLYDKENVMGKDAIEKTLNVLTEGQQKTTEQTRVFKLDGRKATTFTIDSSLPDDTVPGSSSNIFISAEAERFSTSHVKNLLSPEAVARLIVLPTGCLEQTMIKLAPTTSAIRYLDLSDQWFDLPPGSRDVALDKVESGYIHILAKKRRNGAYGPWMNVPYSSWMTALVVKVLSLIAERQIVAFGQRGRNARVVPVEEINHSVGYLLSVQQADGSLGDLHPVMHKGVMNNNDQKASVSAFITLALHRSLQFLPTERKNDVEASISRSTTFLLSHLDELQHPYAVAITAYCLAVCLPEGTDHSVARTKLQALATNGTNGCYLWTTDASPQNQGSADAITVDTTAYALLTVVAYKDIEWADKIACWLTTQENYLGGFRSSKDTVNALEALAEYELKKGAGPETNLIAEFTVPGKTDLVTLRMENKKDKVETELKKLAGNNIHVQLTGNGNVKLKVKKIFHLLEPKEDCKQVSIRVTVVGKVKYTAKVIETYEYYDVVDGASEEDETEVPQLQSEQLDASTRNRRALDNNLKSDNTVTYKICVSHSINRNLTGMAIADITLLSGFEAVTQDLEKLKTKSEQYINHYEVSYGRVILYFNELFEAEQCISFDAVQKVPIGLLQPAPAVFYDYYEPKIKCTVFYSAPQRSKMVSRLCSGDVCQCAERPCHKIKETFHKQRSQRITKNHRLEHACFFPTVDYAYMAEVVNVSTKSNFELYKMNVKTILKSFGDALVKVNSDRLFAKRRQCKGELELGKLYLIMGKDGSTTDSDGLMQYLLESNTWVERKPSDDDCTRSSRQVACRGFDAFVKEYSINGCRQ